MSAPAERDVPQPLLDRHLDLDEDALVSCVACGLCLPHCPTYRVTGFEIASPRGRIAAMRAVQLDEAAWSGEFAEAMEACVQCRACEAACPSSVPFGLLMEGTRAALHDAPPRRVPWRRRIAEWAGYRVILPHRRLLVALTWLLLVAQRLHVVPRRFGIPRLHARSLARRVQVPDVDRPDAVLFTGCVMDAWQRDVHRAAVRVMQATGATVGISGRGGACCGALHEHAGRTDEAHALAARVIASMPADAVVVVDSAGCGAAMKDYGRWLGTDEARAFAARVRDFSEWLCGQGVPVMYPTGRRVVVQDPCHLRNVQGSAGAVRTALVGAYELVDTDDDGLCCGAGGAYSVTQAGLSGEIRERKAAAIRDAAGDAPALVASANPGCAMHLAAAGLDVAHPAELLADALRTPDATTTPDDRKDAV
ncbi:MAG: (Fe-S)-binding protein [Acidimicrobiia bacterium]